MTEGFLHYLWTERIGPLQSADLLRLEEPLNLRFFGIRREEEAIVGHRVLRHVGNDATILRVRRDFEAPGTYFVELVSSLEDEDADAWVPLRMLVREQVRQGLHTNLAEFTAASPKSEDAQASEIAKQVTTPLKWPLRLAPFVVGGIGIATILYLTIIAALDQRSEAVLAIVGSAVAVVAATTAALMVALQRRSGVRQTNPTDAVSTNGLFARSRRRKDIEPIEALMRVMELEALRDGRIGAHSDQSSVLQDASTQMDQIIQSWHIYWQENINRHYNIEKLERRKTVLENRVGLAAVDVNIERLDADISAAHDRGVALQERLRRERASTPDPKPSRADVADFASRRWSVVLVSGLIYLSACIVEIALNYLAFQLMGQSRLETLILSGSVVLVNVLLPKQLGDLVAQRSYLAQGEDRRWNAVKLLVGSVLWVASSLFVAVVRAAYLLYQGTAGDSLIRQSGLGRVGLTLGWLGVAVAVGLVVALRSAYTYRPPLLRRAGVQVKRATAAHQQEVARRARLMSGIETALADDDVLMTRQTAALRSTDALASELQAHYRRHLLRAVELRGDMETEISGSRDDIPDVAAITSLAHAISFDGVAS